MDTMNWHDYFTYDAGTGNLIWKERPLSMFKNEHGWRISNGRFANKVTGSKSFHPNGNPKALDVRFNDRLYKAHRIIWEMMIGPIPDGMVVDHKDCNPFNNKLDNLRLATKTQNGQNRGKQINNTCGYKGVVRDGNRYAGRIKTEDGHKHLGCFATPEEAHEVYCEAAQQHHGEFNNTGTK
jgi:hypothetical protein